MPKSILLAPWTDSKGEPHAAGAEVDVSDEEYQALRQDGKIANTEQPYQGQEGHYGDVTTRTDVQGTAVPTLGDTDVNKPSSDDDDDEDKPVNRSSRKR
jgi:hypothetical protein